MLDNADTQIPLTQACLPTLINSPTGHYNSTGMHSTASGLPFTPKETSETHLCSAQKHNYTMPYLPDIY